MDANARGYRPETTFAIAGAAFVLGCTTSGLAVLLLGLRARPAAPPAARVHDDAEVALRRVEVFNHFHQRVESTRGLYPACEAQGLHCFSLLAYTEQVDEGCWKVTWPFALVSERSDEVVTVLPSWQCDGGVGSWEPCNAAARAIASGELAEAIRADGLDGARPWVSR
jgi:hypothetical protein